MVKVHLFDWGDTLMVDLPNQAGKMCDWPEVKAVDGAVETLAYLSGTSRIYVATNAAESTPGDIETALERVGLAKFINGYFCRANIGIGKGSPAYYKAILEQLGVEAGQATMVGDSFTNDISPALEAGLSAVWLRPGNDQGKKRANLRTIASLHELHTAN